MSQLRPAALASLLLAGLLVAHAAELPRGTALFPEDTEIEEGFFAPSDYTAEAQADRVHHLPGAPPAHRVRLFSGYITVDPEAGRSLFYAFVESAHSPRTDPLVLWLNGGPGCSSLGGGFLAELGPFYPTPGGHQLVPNKFAWNTVANMLFLESPAFVGFSYSNTTSDAVVGDKRTAVDSREFLLRWLDRFPQYRDRPFWLSGESYAGHYVPNLAAEILEGNRNGRRDEKINLQGFLVGEPTPQAGQGGELPLCSAAALARTGGLGSSPQREPANVRSESTRQPHLHGAAAGRGGRFSSGPPALLVIFPLVACVLGAGSVLPAPVPAAFACAAAWCAAGVAPRVWCAACASPPWLAVPGSRQCLDGRLHGEPGGGDILVQPWHHLAHRHQGHEGQLRLQQDRPAGAAAIISSETRDGALKNCDFAHIYPLAENEDVFVSAEEGPTGAPPLSGKAKRCDRFVNQAMEEMGGINIYEIYADVCLNGPAKQARQLALMLRDHPAGLSTRHMLTDNPAYDPCIDSETEAYLNRADVQQALHANVSGDLPGPWQDCTSKISYSRRDLLSSMLPVYKDLLDQGIKILVYSGDVDAIVPVIGTRNWINGLDLPVKEHWRPWRSTTGQVGGWTVEHEGLTFASVRGAGHMVPYTQPERALYLFSKWVHQQRL